MVHDYIRESRKDKLEEKDSGVEISEITYYPPCMTDISLFSDKPSDIIHNDPLDWRNLPPIDETLSAYSFCARPYGRMFSDEEGETWVNDPEEQRKRLDIFFDEIEEHQSLAFFYTNHGNPLIDESGDRLLIGVARIIKKGPQHYFPPTDRHPGDYPLWSRAITIDPSESFFIPYQEYLDRGEDCSHIICSIPNSIRANYSYVSEHLTDDVAVISLESLIEIAYSLHEDGIVHKDWESKIDWLNNILGETWKNRGAFPGIAGVLDYLEFRRGSVYQYNVLKKLTSKGIDAWDHVTSILNDDHDPENEYLESFMVARSEWNETTSKKRNLLSILALFELSPDQIKRVANSKLRENAEITANVDEIIENPYVLCEQDIGGKDSPAIGFEKIDHGMIPLPDISDTWGKRAHISSKDKRRVRALIVEVLRAAANEGHTILPLNDVVERLMKKIPDKRKCEPDPERILEQKEFYKEVIEFGTVDSNPHIALRRISEYEKKISQQIRDLVSSKNLDTSHVDWAEKLACEFGQIKDPSADNIEVIARKEKAIALEKIFSQRFSILTGRAGTGKTSVANILLQEIIKKGGHTDILLLAPTGKARIRLQEKTGKAAQTIHQFLFQNKWMNPDIFTFKETGGNQVGASTIIIDEASMIPVDLLGTLFNAIRFNDVKRLILIGDSNQLPPIGPGRPFVDIINWLKRDTKIAHIAYLRERRRQKAAISNALVLSDGYVSEYPDPNDDAILSEISKGFNEGDLEVHFWKNEDELYEKLGTVMAELLSIDDTEKSYISFNKSLGINLEDPENTPENWQILSPVRMHRYGTRELNRIIQRQYKGKLLSVSRWSKNPKPFGNEKIVWTDKVIQNRNSSRRKWDGRSSEGYVANGEIGYVRKTGKGKKRGSDTIDVSFSTQQDCTYRYYRSQVDENLELAYAITVHKAQGSDFEYVFLIIPQKVRNLSKELIYTGLTRFKEKLVLFIEKDIAPLRTMRKMQHSETIRRNTNLFEPIIITESITTPHPENLIHKTLTKEMVRSKSEVIIGNILTNLSIDYEYEKPLEISKTNFRLPDFTITYRGRTFYWEHLGMLNDASYHRSWQKKLQWYTENGFLESLITSEDDVDGSIDSNEIEQIAKDRILNK